MILRKIKCVVLDIDGTLTNSKGQISDYTKKVIKNLVNKDIKVILASGRNIDNVVKISKICNASNIVISNNGAVIYDYLKNKFLFFNIINKELINEIWKLCSKYNIDSIYNSSKLRYRNYKNLDKSYNEKNDVAIETVADIKNDIYQIVLLSYNVKILNCCMNDIKKYELKISNTAKGSNGIIFADINLENTSKGKAINEMCKLLNIKKSNIICFGDSMNDIEMFNNCGIKVAMKNSILELKQSADYITKYSNEEDGAAKFLENYFDL